MGHLHLEQRQSIPLAKSSRENILNLQTRDVQRQDMLRIYIYIYICILILSKNDFQRQHADSRSHIWEIWGPQTSMWQRLGKLGQVTRETWRHELQYQTWKCGMTGMTCGRSEIPKFETADLSCPWSMPLFTLGPTRCYFGRTARTKMALSKDLDDCNFNLEKLWNWGTSCCNSVRKSRLASSQLLAVW